MPPPELDGYLTGIVVTPQAAPILPSAWMARLWGDDEPIFEDEMQINAVLGAVMIRIQHPSPRHRPKPGAHWRPTASIDYRPLFLSRATRSRAHDAVRAWARGFWKAMTLAPATWSEFVEDERTKIVLEPFIGFFDLDALRCRRTPIRPGRLLDAEAALIPRMILILRKLARIREAAGRRPAPILSREKVGRNDPCRCGSGKKYKRCCARA